MKIEAQPETYARVVEGQLNEANRERNIYLARIIELEAENKQLKEENNKVKPKSAN
ncbi:hypothetical protein [Bacillus wiedmannii]|uniref:hypothetical protein n=1 Tax=Bacillus wiedmannii TaxID=1890302 RepID=UPI0015D4760D|nr:hypothetical protein [Bacillus wiedmannii]